MKYLNLKTILSLVALSLSTAAYAGPFWLISDVDDTVKVTDAPDAFHGAINGMFSDEMFVGMSSLYQGLVQERFTGETEAKPIFLSGGPIFLRGHLEESLRKNEFPSHELILRGFGAGSVPQHKRKHLEELSEQSGDTPFVLLGDDGQADPETLSDFAIAHLGKVLKIYIHRVLGRSVPAGVTTYNTSFEVALIEFDEGRLSEDDAVKVGEELLMTEKPKDVFPDFVECPRVIDFRTTDKIAASSRLMDLIEKNKFLWSRYCQNHSF
jgi:phosphatidate phosphatase APP1